MDSSSPLRPVSELGRLRRRRQRRVAQFFPFTQWQLFLLSLTMLAPARSDNRMCHWLAFWLGRVFIVPITNLTPQNTEFQLYLLTAFHRHPISYFTHLCVMPCVILELAYVWGAGFTVPLGICWVAMALSGRKLWALVNCALAISFHLLAPYFGAYNPLSPIATILTCCFAIAVSHAAEEVFPPRAAHGLRQWTRLKKLIERKGLPFVGANVLFSLACGTIQEFVATLRIFPFFGLILLLRLGYHDPLAIAAEKAAHTLMKLELAALDGIALTTSQRRSFSAYRIRKLRAMTEAQRVANFVKISKELGLKQRIKTLAPSEPGTAAHAAEVAALEAEIDELQAMLSNKLIWSEAPPAPAGPLPAPNATGSAADVLIDIEDASDNDPDTESEQDESDCELEAGPQPAAAASIQASAPASGPALPQ